MKSRIVCVRAKGRYKRELLGGSLHSITKEPEKKINPEKKEIGGLTTYRHAACNQKVAPFLHSDFYSYYAQRQFGHQAAWISSRARHSRNLRFAVAPP